MLKFDEPNNNTFLIGPYKRLLKQKNSLNLIKNYVGYSHAQQNCLNWKEKFRKL